MSGRADDPWARSRKDPDRYHDILDAERPYLPLHPPMSLKDRAAQFAPFAALTGFEDVIRKAEEESEEANR